MIDLRTFTYIDILQPQLTGFLQTVSPGFLPLEGQAVLFVEVAPGLSINTVTDIALKQTAVEPGLQIVERAYGVLELHSFDQGQVRAAGDAILRHYGMKETDRYAPRVLTSERITGLDGHQAMLINRMRHGDMISQGQTLYVMECEPAGYACIAANEAEKAADVHLLEVVTFGSFGRLYLGGYEAEIEEAEKAIKAVLAQLKGRPLKGVGVISTSDFKKGQRVELDGQPWSVERSTTQSPSARGGATLVKARLRNILTGQITDRTFKAGEKFPEPDLQLRPSQFLYRQVGDDSFVFMDLHSYEQFELGPDSLGEDAQWLVDNLEVRAIVYNEKVVSVDLPQFVEMALADVAPGTKGDTASGGVTTTATTVTGINVQVPLYIKAGDVVRIDTTTGTFKIGSVALKLLDTLRQRLDLKPEGGAPFGAFEAGLLVTAAVGMVVMHFGGSEQVFLDLFGERLRGDYGPSGDLHPYFALFGLTHWVGACVVGYMLIPMLYLKLCGRRIRDYYVSPMGFIRHVWIYLALVTPLMLVVWGVSYLPDFQRIYPFYVFAGRSFFDLIAWELLYGLQFFALEFFFRGFFLHGLRACLGYGAIFVMLVPYCMVHFLKTAAESLGSLIAGIVLGTLSMKYRSIWGGVLAHWLVAIAMDVASMLQKGIWPTRFWP